MTMDYSLEGNVVPAVLASAVRKYRLMKVSGNHTYAECDAEEISCGVSKDAGTAAGDVVRMVIDGYAKVQAGGTITAGQFVNADADGKAVAETTTNKWASGRAVNGASDGDYFTVDLNAAGYISSS